MNTKAYLWEAAKASPKAALPILSFPAVQKMGITVGELLRSSSLQAQAMRLIAAETPTLAAVAPMDLSVEAEAFGAKLRFSEHEVPTVIGSLVKDEAALCSLPAPKVGDGRTGICIEALRLAKGMIPDKPVLAGVIGPYSLAGRLCDVTEIMYLCYDEPELVHQVLQKATDFLIRYCLALRSAGADGMILAEPLAGLLSPELSGEFAHPYVRQLIEAVQSDTFAVIYHNCGNAVLQMADQIFSLNAAAYHFGNAVSMRKVLDLAPKNALCMGNIDPAAEFASPTPDSIGKATRELLSLCGKEVNFLPSSGCDIPPHAKWENIHAFFDALQTP